MSKSRVNLEAIPDGLTYRYLEPLSTFQRKVTHIIKKANIKKVKAVGTTICADIDGCHLPINADKFDLSRTLTKVAEEGIENMLSYGPAGIKTSDATRLEPLFINRTKALALAVLYNHSQEAITRFTKALKRKILPKVGLIVATHNSKSTALVDKYLNAGWKLCDTQVPNPNYGNRHNIKIFYLAKKAGDFRVGDTKPGIKEVNSAVYYPNCCGLKSFRGDPAEGHTPDTRWYRFQWGVPAEGGPYRYNCGGLVALTSGDPKNLKAIKKDGWHLITTFGSKEYRQALVIKETQKNPKRLQ